MLVVDDKVANCGCCYETGKSKYVGEIVDLFMARLVEFERRFDGRGEFGGCRSRQRVLLISVRLLISS
jgi:hypothetical protein